MRADTSERVVNPATILCRAEPDRAQLHGSRPAEPVQDGRAWTNAQWRLPAVPGPAAPWSGLAGRGALTLTAMAWAFAMALPVAWALMRTRRLRYDPSLATSA